MEGEAMRFMRGIVGLIPALALAGCQQPASTPATPQATVQVTPAQPPVERGKYLVSVAGCNDCHTPKTFGPNGPEADLTRTLSGNPSTDKLAAVPAGLLAPDKFGTVANNHLTAWVGPWGVSFAMNLTPDKATGLGSWTQEMFVTAIRTGKHQGTGRAILPPMPWNWYRNMTDDDLKAVFAYLQSLPPINNPIPDPLPPDKIPR
jgi:mono/diheme cytochrome c family protein